MDASHDLGSRRGLELSLQLVQESKAITHRLVAEVVHQPGKPVDRTQVWTRPTRSEKGDDRKVLAGRARFDALCGQIGSVEKTRCHGRP